MCDNHSHDYKGIKSNPSSGGPEPLCVGRTAIKYEQMSPSPSLVCVVGKIQWKN